MFTGRMVAYDMTLCPHAVQTCYRSCKGCPSGISVAQDASPVPYFPYSPSLRPSLPYIRPFCACSVFWKIMAPHNCAGRRRWFVVLSGVMLRHHNPTATGYSLNDRVGLSSCRGGVKTFHFLISFKPPMTSAQGTVQGIWGGQ